MDRQLGAMVRTFRQASGLTQEELAARAGISVRSVRNLEQNTSAMPQRETLRLVADALGLRDEQRAMFLAAGRRSADGVPPGHILAPIKVPGPSTPLLGRAQEVRSIRQMLATSEVRLVTLSGPAGVGKTRLATEVALQEVDRWPDGTFLVPLASINDREGAIATLAQRCGLTVKAGQSVEQAALDCLAAKRALLLLDNFEHIMEAASLVAKLLECCPHLRVLVTSREVLRLRAEHEFPVAPLKLPPEERTTDSDAWNDSPAVQMFVARAQAVDASFRMDDQTGSAVVRICRRLDGLPLAIELAAPLLKVLSPPALADRLSERLTLLTDGPRDLPARQRSLRAALEWSFELLSPPEQQALQCLATLQGEWTLEAAVCVYGQATDEATVVRLLAALIDKSLLVRVPATVEEPRFGMLPTIQEYALERLRATGDASVAQARHAAYFLARAEVAESELMGPGQGCWLDHVQREHANMQAALQWALVHDHRTALRLAGALSQFWWLRGHIEEGRRQLDATLARFNASEVGETAPYMARAFSGAGVLATAQGDYPAATGFHERALALRRETGDRLGEAQTLNALALISRHRSDYVEARRLFSKSLEIHGELGNEHGAMSALHNLASVAHMQGEYDRAERMYEDALRITRTLPDRRGEAIVIGNLGLIAHLRGDMDRAWQQLLEALAIHEELQNTSGIAMTHNNLAMVANQVGRHVEASGHLEQALVIFRELGDKLGIVAALDNLGETARYQHDLARAEQLYGEALELAINIRAQHNVAILRSLLGHVARDQGDFRRAAQHYGDVLNAGRDVVDVPTLAACIEGMAALVSPPQAARAVRLFAAAAAMREAAGVALPMVDKPMQDRDLAALRQMLGPDEFDTLWSEGTSLTREQAIALAEAQE